MNGVFDVTELRELLKTSGLITAEEYSKSLERELQALRLERALDTPRYANDSYEDDRRHFNKGYPKHVDLRKREK